jgi:DNA-binding transcriptional regulator YiaG
MKNLQTFEEFLNEQEEMINEDATSALMLMTNMALLGAVLARTGVLDPVADWVEDKINDVKSKIRRHRKMKMTNATYQDFADKIPQIYQQLEKYWEAEIKRLQGELESALAAKETFSGDKRTKNWTDAKNAPIKIQREISELTKKDFFKYIYTSQNYVEKNKEIFPELDNVSSEQISLIAKMIRDYVKDGKVKDSYWTERKYDK